MLSDVAGFPQTVASLIIPSWNQMAGEYRKYKATFHMARRHSTAPKRSSSQPTLLAAGSDG
jgi:hypothetical protein